jgi:integrase
MRTTLTAAFCKIATAEAGKDRTVFWDRGLAGFGLCVTAGGAKSWVVQYRANGQSRRMAIDSRLSLADARKEAKKRMGEVAKGTDPLMERRKQAAANKAAKSGTLEYIAQEYFRREGRSIRTMQERKDTFGRAILPRLGKYQIEQIRRLDIVRLLDQIEDERGPGAADKALAFLSRLFNWYAARSDDFKSPIVRGMRRYSSLEHARDRILSDDEIRKIWTACDKKPGPFSFLVKLLLLTATRRCEASKMTRAEIEGNEWIIPGSRYKTKQQMVVPLSDMTMEVFKSVPAIGQAVFTYDGEKPINGFAALKRGLDKASGVRGWVLHDLRRTARSLMSRAGVSADIAERCLGHVIAGVRGVYDRHAYAAEKRQAFEALAAEVLKITSR